MSSKSSVHAFFSRLWGASTQPDRASRDSSSTRPSTALEPNSEQNGHSKRPSSRRRIRKPVYQRWWIWMLLGIGASSAGTWVTVDRALQVVERGLPDVDPVLTYVRGGTLTLKTEDGTVLHQIGPATRDRIQFEDIPSLFIKAFVAAEDRKFYDHDGIDYSAIARALYTNISAGEVVEGGSTITQQLARIVFLDQSRTLERKLREAMLAQKIERELSKDTILERYLNLVYLGSGAYGVADASWIYFSKPIDELTLSEMAMIAGLAPAPSLYSPLVDINAARRRRDLTLERMVEAEFITEAEMERAIAQPIELNPSLPKYYLSDTPYFTSYIQQVLPSLVSPEELEAGGLTVETTLNLEWQRHAEATVRKAIEEYGPGQGFEQAALVAIDPRTGAIRAMVGGDDFNESQFNRVTQAERQPGSTFKTFVYATAVASGFSPEKTYVDAHLKVDGYEPNNYGDRFRGTVSIRDALVSSINVVAVKTLIDVGFDPIIEVAHRMGIRSELLPTYSLALGTSEVNLLELTSAYGTLANRGTHVAPHGIVRILNRYNDVIYEANAVEEQGIDADTASIVTWMLQAVVQSGTGRRAQIGRPAAGKTGTSEDRRDLWFIGYIPQLVTGVWLGNDDNRPTRGASGTAAQTWRDFMAQIVEEMPVEEFPTVARFTGRTATIEAQPVKPRQLTEGRQPGDSDDSGEQSAQQSEVQPEDSDLETEARGRGDRPSGAGTENRRDTSDSSSGDRGSSRDSGSGRSDADSSDEPAPVEPVRDRTPDPVPAEPPAADPPPPPAPSVPVTEPIAPIPAPSPPSTPSTSE